jgi:hypothetical protein
MGETDMRMSRYEFTDSNGYRAGPAIEARTASEARARVEGITGLKPRYCTHLSDDHGRASDMAPVTALPDPEDMYGHLFERGM